ncbi:hypothetical protein D9M72_624020 [compost metagenome]
MIAVVRPKVPTASNDVPTALMSGMPVASRRPGTIRKPPPMPKKPEQVPVKSAVTPVLPCVPIESDCGVAAVSHFTFFMAKLTNIITSPNRNSRRWPSTSLPRLEPR